MVFSKFQASSYFKFLLSCFQRNFVKKNSGFHQLSVLVFFIPSIIFPEISIFDLWKPLRVRKELNKNCLAWFSYEYTLVWPCRVALIQQSPTAALIIRSHMLQIPRSFHYKQFSQQSLTLDSPASGPDVLLLLLFNIQEVDQKIIKLCDKWCDPNYLVALWSWQHGQDEEEEQLSFPFEDWTFLRVCGSEGEETSWVFPVLILSPVKMVLETRSVKPKRTSICQLACFRSVTLDFPGLDVIRKTWHSLLLILQYV